MHAYASDDFTQGEKVYFALGAVAIALAPIIRKLFLIPLTGYFDGFAVAVSAGAIYKALVLWYDQCGWHLHLWKLRLSTLPDLNGTWRGNITTTYNNRATLIPCVMRVHQTWRRLAIELETEQSMSQSIGASLCIEQSCAGELEYKYDSRPKQFAPETMQAHRGSCTLKIVPGTTVEQLNGDYFTGRGRETRGEISLRRVNRKMLDYDAAMKEWKQ